MNRVLKKLYNFLFWDHSTGFVRFCYAMLIPCAFSDTIRNIWSWVMIFVMALVAHANAKGWNRRGDNA